MTSDKKFNELSDEDKDFPLYGFVPKLSNGKPVWQ